MKFKFAKEIYNKEALLKAAYSYTDRAYIHLDADENNYFVDVNLKDEKCSATIHVEDFQNEILAQMVRQSIHDKTKNIRELILARAFSSTVISDVPSYQPEEGIGDINDILKDWFEKYE